MSVQAAMQLLWEKHLKKKKWYWDIACAVFWIGFREFSNSSGNICNVELLSELVFTNVLKWSVELYNLRRWILFPALWERWDEQLSFLTFTLIHKNYRYLPKYPKLWGRWKLGHRERLTLNENICQEFKIRVKTAQWEKRLPVLLAEQPLAHYLNWGWRASIGLIFFTLVCSSALFITLLHCQFFLCYPFDGGYLDWFWIPFWLGNAKPYSQQTNLP